MAISKEKEIRKLIDAARIKGGEKRYEQDSQRVDHIWPILIYCFQSFMLLWFLKDKKIGKK